MKNLSFLYVVFFLLLLTIIGLIYSRKFLSKIIINKNFKVVNGNELMSPIGKNILFVNIAASENNMQHYFWFCVALYCNVVVLYCIV